VGEFGRRGRRVAAGSGGGCGAACEPPSDLHSRIYFSVGASWTLWYRTYRTWLVRICSDTMPYVPYTACRVLCIRGGICYLRATCTVP